MKSLKYTVILILIFILANLSCQDNTTETQNTDSEDTGNGITTGLFNRELTHNGVIREYVLYVPTSYDGLSSVPVLFNFHGFGGDDSAFLSNADLRQQAEVNAVILVYPQGTLLNGAAHWNAGLDTPTNKSSAADFNFVQTLIGTLANEFVIDRTRIYAAGYSNGGYFTYALACYYSSEFAAIAVVSTTMLEETFDNCAPNHPIGVISIQGTSDGVIPYAGTTGLKPIVDVLNYWADYNSYSDSPTITTNVSNRVTIERQLYGNAVAHYKVIGGSHIWFNLNYEGTSLNQILWDFISQYNNSGLR